MEEMIYKATRENKVLHRGSIDGFDFVIKSLGTHPTAYVRIPEAHPYYQKEYEKCDIDCHGGLTFSEPSLLLGDDWIAEKGWWIGWDYAHWMDFSGCSLTGTGIFCIDDAKRWTTAEIMDEVKCVISQLVDVGKEDEASVGI